MIGLVAMPERWLWVGQPLPLERADLYAVGDRQGASHLRALRDLHNQIFAGCYICTMSRTTPLMEPAETKLDQDEAADRSVKHGGGSRSLSRC
jgi:hypothetical protein